MMRHFSISLVALTFCSVQAQDLPPGPLAEAPSNIGFKTVAEALAALKARRDVAFSIVRGWTIVTDNRNFTVWSFAPQSDPAYPAVVKRQVEARLDGGSDIDMSVLCEASKEACDQMVREFAVMNNRFPKPPKA